ncbi:hypothetical protein ACFL3V_07130 [Nanoarchaeota archaeon]
MVAVRFRPVRGRKGLVVRQVILLAVALGIAFVVVNSIVPKLLRTSDSTLALGPSECTEADKTRPISWFKDNLETYSRQTTQAGVTNTRYSPEDAKEMFRKYLACKQIGTFKAQEVNDNDQAMMDIGKNTYLGLATGVCEEIKLAKRANAKLELKDLNEKYGELAEEYDSFFVDDANKVKFPSSRACV